MSTVISQSVTKLCFKFIPSLAIYLMKDLLMFLMYSLVYLVLLLKILHSCNANKDFQYYVIAIVYDCIMHTYRYTVKYNNYRSIPALNRSSTDFYYNL